MIMKMSENGKKLLAEWEENYDFRRSIIREFYTLRPIAEFERLLERNRRAGRGGREAAPLCHDAGT